MIKRHLEWLEVLKLLFDKKYWNAYNTVEFFAFLIRVIIIVPGLLFDLQFWWLYIFALFTSLALIWSSTKKTLPNLVWFNIVWIFLSLFAIYKHFVW